MCNKFLYNNIHNSRSCRACAGPRLTQRSFYLILSPCQPRPEIGSESPSKHGPHQPRSMCPAFLEWDSAVSRVNRAPSSADVVEASPQPQR